MVKKIKHNRTYQSQQLHPHVAESHLIIQMRNQRLDNRSMSEEQQFPLQVISLGVCASCEHVAVIMSAY